MIALWVSVKIKPEKRAEFLEIIKHDAEHSVADEPGCFRFEVLEDSEEPNHFYFNEVYKDQDALAHHRTTPHFKLWADKNPELLAAPVGRTLANIEIAEHKH
ncbi:MAG: antibiotic biosynthesis monooxygenase [Dehalococcoidia bacterium]|nr:antibiotic biosynthesis monooxygenase [Dehalococcoidia bacterium]